MVHVSCSVDVLPLARAPAAARDRHTIPTWHPARLSCFGFPRGKGSSTLPPPSSTMASGARVWAFVLSLVLSMLQSYSSGRSDSPDQPEFLNWITSFMSLHLSEPLSVSDMAARAGLSASRFSRVFSNRFGRPPHQFLLHLRPARPGPAPPHKPDDARDLGSVRVLGCPPLRQDVQETLGSDPSSYRRTNQPPR